MTIADKQSDPRVFDSNFEYLISNMQAVAIIHHSNPSCCMVDPAGAKIALCARPEKVAAFHLAIITTLSQPTSTPRVLHKSPLQHLYSRPWPTISTPVVLLPHSIPIFRILL
jgi:hypothetical protein